MAAELSSLRQAADPRHLVATVEVGAEHRPLKKLAEGDIRRHGRAKIWSYMFVTLNGVSHYYEDSGGDRPPIVFIHGLGGTHEFWANQQPLSNEFRVITYDERGSGKSEKAAGPYSIEGYPHLQRTTN